MARNKSIGVFDSGFGGLDIVKSLAKGLSDYDLVYLGDTARVPYGNRSKEEIYLFCRQAVDFLFAKKCGLIIFACNTASSGALRRIQREYLPEKYPNERVLGVLIPAAEEAAKMTGNKKIGIIGTKATIRSRAFKRELLKVDKDIKIFQRACPLLVPLIEKGENDSKKTEKILKSYLKPLMGKGVDTLILGCTHYGFLEGKIKGITKGEIKIISESKIISGKLRNYLWRHPEIEKQLSKNKKRQFYSTAPGKGVEVLGSDLFGEKIKIRKADLK